MHDSRGSISNLMAAYAETLDGAQFEKLGALFSNGSVTIEGGPHDGNSASGAGAVAALYRSIVALDGDGRTGTRHFLTNYVIEIDESEDTAIGRSYFAVTQQTGSLPLQLVACGSYHDTFARTKSAWAFATRRIVCDQVGDLSEHML